MRYAITTTVDAPFDQTLAATRDALADQGFGVLTEIDLAATLKAKVGADIAPQVILGACRPQLAEQAVAVEASIGLLLPCNVVVRADGDDGRTIVEAVDPGMMVGVTGNEGLQAVAQEADTRLRAALEAIPTHIA
ncbi:DUF302 domain-containing protein [Janibacter limosus]|jgi:uncharacterized protein (DUF302 family)|uniref:DUF302 domain-containing protein n=1 Tax=Janibacter limosus TaxID=53458 RepID=A0A4P6MZQ3_9MICO|nr:DUF302 domain-containing protein [Janibacter limosus]QBF47665.1 DUF302 domain-containing protein [Janibacter limosus]